MLIDWKTVRIYIKPGPADMRKQINGLSVIVAEEMELDPLSGALYVFCNKRRRLLKVLYWDKTGFCQWLKRLERDTFPWPQSGEVAREITKEQIQMLLSGIDFFKAHTELRYEKVV